MTFLSIRNTKIFIVLVVLLFLATAISPIYILNTNFRPILTEILKNKNVDDYISKIRLYHAEVASSEKKTLLSITSENFKSWEQISSKLVPSRNKILSQVINKKNSSFRDYYLVLQEIGVENTGLIGKMRSHIHSFEKSNKQIKHRVNLMLELRRREKDFLIREKVRYYGMHQIAFSELIKIKLSKKEISFLNNYKQAFDQIFKLIMVKNEKKKQYLVFLQKYDDIFKKELSMLSTSSVDIISEFKKTINLITLIIIISFSIVAILIGYIYIFLSHENKLKSKLLNDKLTLQEELISREKLASLGSLAAGIAHEIKNPLNIIVNAAQIIQSVFEENPKLLEDKDSNLALVEESSGFILLHSQRADSIVKNMLSLSRGGSRDFSLENLSNLVEENYNLAYHSMRATYPFELTLTSEISSITDYKCIRSDLSQAFINLFENSLYALRDKLKSGSYSPEIKIELKESNDSIILTIWDNGIGIPKDVKDKILEPFFTTKPPGEGTGLGLSFISDVIKEHHGKIKIESEEMEYTKIIITLKKEFAT